MKALNGRERRGNPMERGSNPQNNISYLGIDYSMSGSLQLQTH